MELFNENRIILKSMRKSSRSNLSSSSVFFTTLIIMLGYPQITKHRKIIISNQNIVRFDVQVKPPVIMKRVYGNRYRLKNSLDESALIDRALFFQHRL